MSEINWRRVVIKVGSALIAPQGEIDTHCVQPLAHLICQLKRKGSEVILVSSGAVAAARGKITHSHQKPSLPQKQAMAALGQTQLMNCWQQLSGLPCGQLLLTHADLADRRRYVNIKNTLRALIDNQVLPIVNENDTVATDELKVGDNDNLAAQVALMADASLLIILSDVNGLYTQSPTLPGAELLPAIPCIDKNIYALAGGSDNPIATGGMQTKIQAADLATRHGIDTLIASGKCTDSLDKLGVKQISGSWFYAREKALPARKAWLDATQKPKGCLLIDEGAWHALKNNGASLLLRGVTGVEGKFNKGDAVDIAHPELGKLASGLAELGASEVEKLLGRHSQDMERVLGYAIAPEVIHRDNLVILK